MLIAMTVKGLGRARRELQLLTLPPRRKARVMRKMGSLVAKQSRARITRQESLEGGKFAPRKPRDEGKQTRRKLLLGFRRQVRVRVVGETAVIYVSKGIWSYRARQHQEGFTQVVQAKIAEAEARRFRRHRGSAEGPGEMATRRQARRLRALGWKQSQRWMMEHYSRRQAGVMIRHAEGREPKQSWRIVVPARPFLGAAAGDKRALQRILLRELHKTA